MIPPEQAKAYAKGKIDETLTAVVEKAFTDGYDAGYKDAMSELKVVPDNDENGITFVDLGLPSGTLWASDYLREGKSLLHLTFERASPLSLPTYEQFGELIDYCTVSLNTKANHKFDEHIYDIVNNGKKISLSSEAFWLRNIGWKSVGKQGAVRSLAPVEEIPTAELLVRLVKNKK